MREKILSTFRRFYSMICGNTKNYLSEEFMNRYFIIYIVFPFLLLSGCFKHKEAPHRPVTAYSVEQAIELRVSVERIELTGQTVGDLPVVFSSMPKLTILLMRGAEIKSLAALPDLRQLKTLDLSATAISELPLGVSALNGLKQLYLADNQFKSLPSVVGDLKALEYLNLDRNQLTTLPDELGDCLMLRWLRLNSNQVAALPASVGVLKSLQRVYLADNKFETVPDVFKDLPLLEDIDLSGNPIAEFPGWLATLPKLRQLNFDNCKIVKLPENLSAFKELQSLSLARCPLPNEERERIRVALPHAHVAF